MAEQYLRQSSKVWTRTQTEGYTFWSNAPSESTAQQVSTGTDSLDGVKNPDWKRQVRLRVSATTPLSAVRKSMHYKPFSLSENYHYQFVTSVPGGHWRTSHYSHGNYCPDVPTTADIPLSHLTEADNMAKSRLVGKIREAQTALQGGVILGELGQTIRMIKSPFKKIRRSLGDWLKDVKKRTPNLKHLTVARRKDVLQDTWLEYAFGIRPAVNDINDARKAFNDILTNDFLSTLSVRAVGEVEKEFSTALNQPVGAFLVDHVTIHKVLVIYTAGLGAATSAVGHSARAVGLDVSNWLPTVWELIPYSFLIDYITNFGDIVSAASLCSSSTNWINKTVVAEATVKSAAWRPNFTLTKSPTPYGADGLRTWTPGIVIPGAFTSTSRTVNRSAFSGSLVPNLAFSLPGGGIRALNIASLFIRSNRLERALR